MYASKGINVSKQGSFVKCNLLASNGQNGGGVVFNRYKYPEDDISINMNELNNQQKQYQSDTQLTEDEEEQYDNYEGGEEEPVNQGPEYNLSEGYDEGIPDIEFDTWIELVEEQKDVLIAEAGKPTKKD